VSRTIHVDGSASGASFTVSDTEYTGIDWGNSADDVIVLNLENGGVAILNWRSIGSVFVPGASPPPGSYPGWYVETSGPYGGTNGLLVNTATKDMLVTALAESDVIVDELRGKPNDLSR